MPITNFNQIDISQIQYPNGTAIVVPDTVTINTILPATTDTDKFLVSDNGELKFRTGDEVLSDIGGLIQGPTGIMGLGQTGLQGIDGQTGIQGLTGSEGEVGVTGDQGVTGLAGLGQTGIQGQTGISGLGSGATGTAGTIAKFFDNNTVVDSSITETSLGNLGIGYTDSSAKLALNGGFHIGGISNPGDKNLWVDGTVVIGLDTTSGSPAKLHVGGTYDDTALGNKIGVLITPAFDSQPALNILNLTFTNNVTCGAQFQQTDAGIFTISNNNGPTSLSIDTSRNVGICNVNNLGVLHVNSANNLPDVALNVGSGYPFLSDTTAYPLMQRANSGDLDYDTEWKMVDKAVSNLNYAGYGWISSTNGDPSTGVCFANFSFSRNFVTLSNVSGSVVNTDTTGALCIYATDHTGSNSNTLKVKNKLVVGNSQRISYWVVYSGAVL